MASSLQPNASSASAREILDVAAQRYLGCSTYQDQGGCTTQFTHQDGSQHEKHLTFSTAFLRDGGFRYEFHDEQKRYVIGDDGEQARSWWDQKAGVQHEESLDLAIAAATGVSGGTAHTVPRLLMPGRVSGITFTDLVDLKRLDDTKLNGLDCVRVQGSYPAETDPEQVEMLRREYERVTGRPYVPTTHEPMVLWLEQQSLLLRRIEKRSHHGSFTASSVIDYEPLRDQPIERGQLAFDPPPA